MPGGEREGGGPPLSASAYKKIRPPDRIFLWHRAMAGGELEGGEPPSCQIQRTLSPVRTLVGAFPPLTQTLPYKCPLTHALLVGPSSFAQALR